MTKRNFGFTLIELLVVVSLIGVLATLVLSNLNAARERGRDAQRKSDLKSIQSSLQLYYNDYGKYPASSNGTIQGCGSGGAGNCEWGVDEFKADNQAYMTLLPDDPLPSVTYYYTRVDLDTYQLSACLENKSDDKGKDDPSATWCPSEYVYSITP